MKTQHNDVLVGRELLLDVACALFMQNGYDGVSMQQIATAAHMTKGSPYYHFKGKEDLFIHAFTQRVQHITQSLMNELERADTLHDKLVAAFTHMLTTTDPGVVRLFDDFQRVVGSGCTPELAEKVITADKLQHTFEELFIWAAEQGNPTRISPQDAAFSFLALQMGTMMYHMNHATELLTTERAQEIATRSVDIFLNGALAA